MFHFKFFYLSTCMSFWKVEIERTCLPYFAEDFKNKIYRYEARLKNMLVCRHPGLFFRVHPAGRKKHFFIIWRCK